MHRIASGFSNRWRNHWPLRAQVELPFHVLKRQFGYLETRYRGLAKNRAELFALGNLFFARRKLLA